MTQGHTYGELTKITDSTCLVEGEIHKPCLNCEYVHVEYLEKPEHKFVYVESADLEICEICQAMKYNGHIYAIFTDISDWYAAKSHCEDRGGYLATVTSSDELEAMKRYMGYTSKATDVWIGAYKENNVWNWVSGEKFEFSNWDPYEPNDVDGYEYYIEMNHTYFGGWNDEDFDVENNYFCEWEAE